jgi:hypothetical protein
MLMNYRVMPAIITTLSIAMLGTTIMISYGALRAEATKSAPQWIGVIYQRFRKTDGFASQIMKSAIKDSRQTFSDQVRASRSSFNFNGHVYDSNVMIIRNLAFSTVSSVS